MKITKKLLSNVLFYGVIIFLFTPYGKGARAKLIQGVSFAKSFVMPSKAIDISERQKTSSLSLSLKAIHTGEDFDLNDKKGNVILINYWATWCPPCIGEMPSLQNLYNDYKDKVTFVFLTSDKKEKVTKFYNDNNYNLPTYNMISIPSAEINTRSLPTTFIIDKNGKIAYKDTGASNWNSASVRNMLDDLIKE